jgi:hypothetical protein
MHEEIPATVVQEPLVHSYVDLPLPFFVWIKARRRRRTACTGRRRNAEPDEKRHGPGGVSLKIALYFVARFDKG